MPYQDGKDHSGRLDQDTGAVVKHNLPDRGDKLLFDTKRRVVTKRYG